MRWICAPLFVVLAGCGPSQSDVENARQEERDRANQVLANQQAAAAAADCRARETAAVADHNRAIEGDKRTIMTTLGMVSSSEGDLQGAVGVTIRQLDANEFQWVTAAAGASETVGVTGRVNFSVNPASLSPSVDLVPGTDSTGVRFRCNAGNCIRAIGRVTTEADGQSQTTDVDQAMPNAVWSLDTTNRAEAVRDALSDLIGRSANPPRTGTCGPGASGM
jgi:hypothetical protein